ncbi:MAG: methyltransferase [Rhodospirillales bacterium]|nr:methyltransferase [Rhodospirillales bacterium]
MNNDIIHVLNKRVALAQPREGFRTSMDAVFLGAACPVQSDQSVLDLGCGVGSAGLCVLTRVEDTQLYGLDILPDVIELARHNAALNAMEGRCTFALQDIRDFEGCTFDHVICNPPFMAAGAHSPSPSPARAKAIGFGEDDMDLKDWVDCAYRSIKGTGSLTLIHRADALDDIILALGKRFGDTEIIPLWPKAGRPAKRVLVRTRKHRKGASIIHPGIVLHETGGGYTPEAENILRQCASIA